MTLKANEIELFKNREDEYLGWIEKNHNGYVLNIDEPQVFANYPMIHKASHKLLSSPKIGNFTTAQYFKVCSVDRDLLEKWAIDKYQKEVTLCNVCMKNKK